MANNKRQIKRRISTAKNISQITKAMEMVAASKMKKAQDQALASRAYARALRESLQKVAQYTDTSEHSLLQQNETGHQLVVLVSTDKGLCGGLNTNLFRATNLWRQQHPDLKIVAVGKKAVHYARMVGIELVAQFVNLPEHISPEDTLGLTELITDGFLNHEYNNVQIVYMDFINTLSQEVRVTQLLPIAAEEYEPDSQDLTTNFSEYTFEPNAQTILNDLLPYYIENSVYQIFLEARASEHSARMVAMKNASENAGELVDELKLEFNKSRQADITTELLDMTTATLTLAD